MAAADENVAAGGSSSSRADDAPVQDDELDALLAPLAAFRTLVLAVSGGADSTALMLLVQRWAERRAGAPMLIVATVDHGLREESLAEAGWVAQQAHMLGLEAVVLTWQGEKPQAAIQDAARAARYRLLTEFARTAGPGPAAIVTAHTEDDQAETLLMRLARGSGIDGLAAMPERRRADDAAPEVALVRPLLGVSGARLRATLREAGRAWIEDPSNDAERFERVRVRKARPLLTGLGFSNEKLALSARRLARARAALDAAVDTLQCDTRLDVHAGAFASFDHAVWREAPEELRLRLLGRLISSFGGQEEPVRLAQLEALAERMTDVAFEGATLAGCVISHRGTIVYIERELGRGQLPTLVLEPGGAAVWDHRYRVALARESPLPVEVRALGRQAYAELRRQLAPEPLIPASAAATLPAFWHGEELLCVPPLADLVPAEKLWESSRGLYSAEFLG